MNYKDFKEFKNWYEKNKEDIEERFTEKIYEDGFLFDKKYQDYIRKKDEKEALKKLGIKKYLCKKYDETNGIEKNAYYHIIIHCKKDEFEIDKLCKFIKNFSFSYDENIVTLCDINIYDSEKVFKEHQTSLTEQIKNMRKSNSIEEIEDYVIKKCIELKMKDIVENLRILIKGK